MTAADYALLGIDSQSILYVWSWGFGSVVSFHFLGYVVGVAQKAIRQL